MGCDINQEEREAIFVPRRLAAPYPGFNIC